MDRKPRILFLVADTGGGHRSSALAVEEALQSRAPDRFEVTTVNPFPGAGAAGRVAERLYAPVIKRADWLWGALWHLSNNRAALAALQTVGMAGLERSLRTVMAAAPPAAVVSFHPLVNHVAARVRAATAPKVPLLTVVTDLVDVHAAWICRDVDAMAVPTPRGADQCRRAGVEASKIHDLGLPVGRGFCSPPLTSEQRRQLRLTLGLDPGRFTVLLCGGADGSGGLAARGQALLQSGAEINLVAICGRNHAARRLLEKVDPGSSQLLTRGFVENMSDWMKAADLLVTKGGPGTIAEGLCSGLPILITWFLPGQERANVDWLVGSGAGRYVPSLKQLRSTIAELARPQATALERMREAVGTTARPHAARDVAGLILEFIDNSRA